MAIAELDMELFPDNCFNERTLKHEIGGGVVMCAGDRLLGYLLVRWDGEVMDIIRFGVRVIHQGRGLGTRMLHDTLRCSDMDVMLCVDKQNKKAIRFYQLHNFNIIGQLNNSWVMCRTTS